jgi:leucyl-tRNA synthetase
VRDKFTVSPKISGEDLEALARASEAVKRSIGDQEIVNVVVRAPRVISFAVK